MGITLHQVMAMTGGAAGVAPGGPPFGDTFDGTLSAPIVSRDATGPLGGWSWAHWDVTGTPNPDGAYLVDTSGTRSAGNTGSLGGAALLFWYAPDLSTLDHYVEFTFLESGGITSTWGPAIRIDNTTRDSGVSQAFFCERNSTGSVRVSRNTLGGLMTLTGILDGERIRLSATAGTSQVKIENLTTPAEQTASATQGYTKVGTHAGLAWNSSSTTDRAGWFADLEAGVL